MPDHTPGSMGMFVTVDSGKVYFFIGDVAWTAQALKASVGKFWATGMIVDNKSDQTLGSVKQVRELLLKNPGIVVVPAHDSAVQDGLGDFPAWVK
jgi:glyoxylase-like metal-dependent hydrolase (beta-lactamase superfamily II)